MADGDLTNVQCACAFPFIFVFIRMQFHLWVVDIFWHCFDCVRVSSALCVCLKCLLLIRISSWCRSKSADTCCVSSGQLINLKLDQQKCTFFSGANDFLCVHSAFSSNARTFHIFEDSWQKLSKQLKWIYDPKDMDIQIQFQAINLWHFVECTIYLNAVVSLVD